ncbi:MAG: glycosyltransferase family 4 protein [Thermoflexales bacterium]|nr:glycosyltransferase family 4 protein [Thermoflexales bacterium]
MHIGLVIYGALADQSGGYRYDRHLVDALRAGGDTVEILSRPWRGYARHLSDSVSPAWAARLRAFRGEVLLEDELNHPSLLRAGRLVPAGVRRIGIVHHLRASEARAAWQNRGYAAVERAYLRGLDGFIFNSATTRAAVEALIGADKPGCVALPAGDRWKALPGRDEILLRTTHSGPLRVIAVGNLIPRKGLHTLIDAVIRLAPGSVRLRIVGHPTETDYAAGLRRQAEAGQRAAWVRFDGALSDDALGAALRESDVLALPSSYEGYGIVYIEGMGFGLPALASRAGAAGEIITPEADGWLVAPGDAAAIAGALNAVQMDRKRLAAMSLAARARFDVHPSWATSMAKAREFVRYNPARHGDDDDR